MAHSENFSRKDFSLIWNDVKDIIQGVDFAFANNEAPVCDNREWSSFPLFNMHSSYVRACIDAGFNVFSLVNNHVNDQGKEGIISTNEIFFRLKEENQDKSRKIYYSGIKYQEKKKDFSPSTEYSSDEITESALEKKNRALSLQNKFNYTIINDKGFTILFLAVTEILNQNSFKSMVNFVEPGKKGIEELSAFIKEVRRLENPDFFILSFHTSEDEYIIPVKESRKKQYKTYLDSGADIVWANHPHVIRQRELYREKESGKLKKIVFYGNGNTISGQRRNPQYKNPYEARDYTGDGLLYEVKLSRKYNGECLEIVLEEAKAHYITTFIDKDRTFILKKLNNDFIENLENKGENVKARYFTERKNICEKTKEEIIWQ